MHRNLKEIVGKQETGSSRKRISVNNQLRMSSDPKRSSRSISISDVADVGDSVDAGWNVVVVGANERVMVGWKAVVVGAYVVVVG